MPEGSSHDVSWKDNEEKIVFPKGKPGTNVGDFLTSFAGFVLGFTRKDLLLNDGPSIEYLRSNG